MIDEKKLMEMVLEYKTLECYLDETGWEDEDKIDKYNEIEKEILIYLKETI